MGGLKRAALICVYALPVVFAALYTGATEIGDGFIKPWHPNMIDLDVYLRTARRVVEGQPFYNIPGDWLPFIYPPFAAVLMVPLGLMKTSFAQATVLLANAAVVSAVAYRLGARGWKLSLLATACMFFIEPLRLTAGFGQVNTLLMGLVALDLLPGRRVLPRRILPEGWLVGIATAIKLTPALFIVYLVLIGRPKQALTALCSTVAATVIGFLVLPSASMEFWGRLIRGDSGLNSGMKYHMNQSVIGVYIRFTRENPDRIPLAGLALAGIACILGIIAAVIWHRAGEVRLGLLLTAFTALIVSPISWSHHYVWVMPLVVLLAINSRLPAVLRFIGLGYCLWVMYAPVEQLRDNKDEFTYNSVEQLVAATSVFLGIIFVCTCLVVGLRLRRTQGLALLPLTLRAQERGAPEPEVEELDSPLLGTHPLAADARIEPTRR